MFFRRALAAFLVLLFGISSLFAFTVYAVSNTFFSPSFYEEDISQAAYEFMINATVKNLIDSDEFVAEHFDETDLRREIIVVFPETLFQKMVNQLVTEMESLKEDPNQPITMKMGVYRESLLTLAHNLSYQLFESIRQCKGGEIPEEKSNGLPTCIPSQVEYNTITAPFTDQFEKAIYAAVPEQVQIDLNSSVGNDGFILSNWLVLMDTAKVVFYIVLLSILVIIALLIYKPFSAILSYEGIAFLLAGFLGVIVSYGISFLPVLIGESMKADLLKDEILTFMGSIFALFGAEVQKVALVFLAMGAILILVRLFIKKR